MIGSCVPRQHEGISQSNLLKDRVPYFSSDD